MLLHPTPRSMRLFQSFLLHVILTRISLLCCVESATLRNETDRLSLLAFKDQISEDPNSVLGSWNDSLHFCMWSGVTCSRKHPPRVEALVLPEQSLGGSLSPHIGNLSFLITINLSSNNFQGQIPPEIGQLFRLQVLDLSYNYLDGKIPNNLTHCLELRDIELVKNSLSGEIPFELGSLQKLNDLSLAKNNLVGNIPPSLGNLSSLALLYLSENSLEGSIPHDLGRISNIIVIALSQNKLSGTIPSSFYNLSSIIALDVSFNTYLNGSLPPDLGLALPNLEGLLLGGNQFTGQIPVSLGNASWILDLDVGFNELSGYVPMNLGGLQRLQRLVVQGNYLGGGKGDDLSFIAPLTNCSDLQLLAISKNQFTGVLPESLSNLSTKLEKLLMFENNIFGNIPTGIQNLPNLNELLMSDNLFTGNLFIDFGKLPKLQIVDFSTNRLSGQIPGSLGNLTGLLELYLSKNDLQGNIPLELKNCQSLQKLIVYSNGLNGTIPREVLNIPSLIGFAVDMNFLTGPLPLEGDKLKNLMGLGVSDNRFSGDVPSSIGNCISLEYLDMEGNFFRGSIPPSLSALRTLRELDLSRNNLSGQFPTYLEQFPFLEYLNLSFNDLEGEVPTHGIFQNASAISILGNKKLCGGIPNLHLPTCPKQAIKKHKKAHSLKVIIPVVTVVLCLFLLSCLLVTFYWLKKKKKSKKPTSPSSAMKDLFIDVSYAELLKATEGFSSANLIGVGSFGSVYKGNLDRIDKPVAIKVLKIQQLRASKSFLAECSALRSIKHRNIIKVLTVCSSIDFKGNDFKALVFEYMPNGSLDTWLHPDVNAQLQARNLNFIQRLNVAIDVASALDYLHQHCQTPVVHCDLKPGNILLDHDMVANVGDFGLARILSEEVVDYSRTQSSSIGIKGSVGYVAPEYGMGGEISTLGDIYSYGVLLLEMFTGKRPTDDMFKDNLNIHQFVKMALPDQVMEIIDHRFLLEEIENIRNKDHDGTLRNRMHDCVMSIMKMGVSCSSESPRDRMETKNILIEMLRIRDTYLGA